MKIYNKAYFFIGFVIIAVPNWFPQYQHISRYLIRSVGIVLMILAFIKPKERKKKIVQTNPQEGMN